MEKRSFNILIIMTLLISVAAFSFLIIKYNYDIDKIKKLFVSEKMTIINDTKRMLELRFSYFYQALRTMSLLPSVRNIKESRLKLNENDMETLKQIYNNSFINVNMSEIYLTLKNLDPDKIDPKTGKNQVPFLTLDHNITQTKVKKQNETKNTEEIEEVEIYEYRMMKSQLEFINNHYSTNSSFTDMNVPALMGKNVITCDNNEFTRKELDSKNDYNRLGFVYTVPFYRGC